MRSLIFTLLLFVVITFESVSQTTVEKSVTTFDPSGRIYNKFTGKKISDDEFADFIKNNPRVSFENVVNKYGEVEKYLLDTTRRNSGRISKENQTKLSEELPEFVFKSIENKEIISSELEGKWVLLRFEIFLKMVDSLSIVEFDKQISKANDKEDILMIICFMESKSEIISKLNTDVSNIYVIPDAKNFHNRYSIAQMPTTILLDPDGRVVRYYYSGDKIDINTLTEN